MIGLETIINTVAIIVGGIIGHFTGKSMLVVLCIAIGTIIKMVLLRKRIC